MPSRWDAATHGWSRRVFHYPLPTLMSRNFRLPCTIELQPLSFTLLKMRKVELGPALGERGRDHGRLPSTSGWLVIATDEWGKEVAQRHFGPADPTVKVVTAGENVTGEWPLIPTSNVVQVRPGPFAVGHVDSAIASLVAGRAASGFRGTSSSKVFMWVEQWYDTTKSRMAAALGLRSSDVDPIIDGFVENGFMSRYGRNIRVSAAGWKRSARRDRVHLSTIRERWQFLSDPDDVHRARNRHHQQGLIILAETCIRYQLPVAAGWRSVMNIPGVTQIHPDAMVLVGDGPLGAGWYCLEYERSATTPKLDFTQNLEEATDAITLGRRHSWLESEGFSLSAANADVQELPATPYH